MSLHYSRQSQTMTICTSDTMNPLKKPLGLFKNQPHPQEPGVRPNHLTQQIWNKIEGSSNTSGTEEGLVGRVPPQGLLPWSVLWLLSTGVRPVQLGSYTRE
ncbi:hypothetical protein J6590_046122 [Homalodisca vitripennis]|nr:hypothetical protein J6590_046122 [Homalodisca vitripennis]